MRYLTHLKRFNFHAFVIFNRWSHLGCPPDIIDYDEANVFVNNDNQPDGKNAGREKQTHTDIWQVRVQ